MRLFGEKSNQQSTNTEVPLELRPYYTQTASQSSSRLAVLVIILLLIIAGISAGLWFYIRQINNQPNATVAQTHQTNQTKKPSVQQKKPGSLAPVSPSGQSTTGSSPSPVPLPSPSQPSQTSVTPSSPASTSTVASGSIPNTGVGSNILLFALIVAVIGTVVSYIRQLYTSRT